MRHLASDYTCMQNLLLVLTFSQRDIRVDTLMIIEDEFID